MASSVTISDVLWRGVEGGGMQEHQDKSNYHRLWLGLVSVPELYYNVRHCAEVWAHQHHRLNDVRMNHNLYSCTLGEQTISI